MFLSIIVDTLISVGHMYRGEVARLWGMCMLRFSKYKNNKSRILHHTSTAIH